MFGQLLTVCVPQLSPGAVGGMTAICAFERLNDVSNRRLADVADRGLGRLNWADSSSYMDRLGKDRS